jgi:hypothetical protein
MNRFKKRLSASGLALVLTLSPLLFLQSAHAQAPAGQQFTIVDLTPTGMSGNGLKIIPGQTVGSVGNFPGGAAPQANHAFLWADGALAPVDLHPSFLDFPEINAAGNSFALATDGVNQVGYGVGAATNQRTVALRWSGTADSAEVLQPPFNHHNTKALGTCGGQSVGYGLTVITVNGRGTVRQVGDAFHAVLWNAGSTVGIDLNNGAQATVAVDCDGGRQVGYGGSMDISGNIADTKAMMWFGNRNSFIWLHPNGYASSQAVAISGANQVGNASVQILINGRKTLNTRAVMWSGSAASVLELPPLGGSTFNYYATGVSNGKVVGYNIGMNLSQEHALYWASAMAPAIDLNQFLPAEYIGATANSIDATGCIIGTAFDGGGTPHAIMWVPAL